MKDTIRDLIRSSERFFALHRKFFQRQSLTYKLYPGQPQILACIRQNPGCTQVDIAEELGISSASVASSTKRLQKAGFLQKQVNSLNMRCNKLYLTPEGEQVLDGFLETFDKISLQMFEGFTEDEIRQFAALTERINKNLERKLAEPSSADTKEENFEEY